MSSKNRMDREEEIRRKRQSEVSKAGRETERWVKDLIESDEEIRTNAIVVLGNQIDNVREIPREEKEKLFVEYVINTGKEEIREKFKIDDDIVIYSKVNKKIVCVISVKKSFRERGGETTYWGLKKRLEGRDFKYICVTPDVDNELFNPKEPNKRKKWRIILTAELDGVFVIKDDIEYEEGNFKVGKKHLINFIKELLKSP